MLAQDQRTSLYFFSIGTHYPLSAMRRRSLMTNTIIRMAQNTRGKAGGCRLFFVLLSLTLHLFPVHLGGFLTPFWRNTFVFSVLVTGFYKFAPAPGDDTFLTQYLAQFNTPKEAWARINEKHVLDATTASEQLLLQASAQRPKVHRYRYPQWV